VLCPFDGRARDRGGALATTKGDELDLEVERVRRLLLDLLLRASEQKDGISETFKDAKTRRRERERTLATVHRQSRTHSHAPLEPSALRRTERISSSQKVLMTWIVWSAQLSMATVPCSTPVHAGCAMTTTDESRTSHECADARKQACVCRGVRG